MAKQIYNVGGVKVRAETPEIASSLAGEIAGTKASVVPSTSSNPVAPTSPAIPADVLTAPTPTPIKVTAPSPAMEGAALDSTLSATAKRNIEQDAFTAQQAQETAKAEAPYKASLSEMMKGILGTKGATELTSEAYKTGGVDVSKKALTDINQKILADQEAERVRIMDLRKNAGGLEASGLAQIEQEIQDKGIQRRAALAVTQLAAQGEYYGAKEVADRAVAASVERQKNRNDALQFIYQENKEQFTKAEQRQFETAQADRNREIDNTEYRLRAEFAQNLQENSPTARLDRQLKGIQIAKSQLELEALKNPASIQGLSKETADRMDKLPLTEKDSLVNAGDTVDQLTRLKNLVATTDIATLQNPLTEEGILFNRLATDVADKMARKRTGAVVTDSEQANFKKILGLSFFTRLNSDPNTVGTEIDKFINLHNQTATLIDPRGDIRAALKNINGGDATQSYVDSVTNTLGGNTDPLGSFLSGFNTKK